MPNPHTIIKYFGLGTGAIGVGMAVSVGQTDVSTYMISAGCLMYLAVKIGEWWERK